MRPTVKVDSVAALRTVLQPFCQKYGIRRLEVFGSIARGEATPDSDVDLLVTFNEGESVPTAALLEMAGEAEELLGRPVDFVLRRSLLESPNRFAREQILGSVVSVYGKHVPPVCRALEKFFAGSPDAPMPPAG